MLPCSLQIFLPCIILHCLKCSCTQRSAPISFQGEFVEDGEKASPSWVLCPRHPHGCPAVVDQPSSSAGSTWERYSPRLWEAAWSSPSLGLCSSLVGSWQTYNPALWEAATPTFSASEAENWGAAASQSVGTSWGDENVPVVTDPEDPLEGTSQTFVNLLHG